MLNRLHARELVEPLHSFTGRSFQDEFPKHSTSQWLQMHRQRHDPHVPVCYSDQKSMTTSAIKLVGTKVGDVCDWYFGPDNALNEYSRARRYTQLDVYKLQSVSRLRTHTRPSTRKCTSVGRIFTTVDSFDGTFVSVVAAAVSGSNSGERSVTRASCVPLDMG